MSICNKCRYRVDGRIWCLKFDPQNWSEWIHHMDKMKDSGLTKCELFKSENA